MGQLEQIIRDQCLPQGDCMLTVTDPSGEAGFLYFKEGELIEANYAALWGKEAVAELKNWEISEHTVAPLPLGIKRSLWDSLELLLAADPNAVDSDQSSVTPKFSTEDPQAQRMPYETLAGMPGVTKIVQFSGGKHEVAYESDPDQSPRTEWTEEFVAKAKGVGDTLGMGKLSQWSVNTDKYTIVGMRHSGKMIGVVRRAEGDLDEFEHQCRNSLEDL